MKTSLFAVIITVLLLVLVVSTVKADNTETIESLLEFYGPPEDINHDGDIDYKDASLFVNHYGQFGDPGGRKDSRWDINEDWYTDYKDGSRFVNKYGLSWLVP